MIKPTLFLSQVKDVYIRKNFETVLAYLTALSVFADFRFIVAESPGAVQNYKIPHGLGFVPKDILDLRPVAGVVWKYDQFTKDYLVVTTSAALNFRGLVGTYGGNNGSG